MAASSLGKTSGLSVTAMQVAHDLGQVFDREIGRSRAGVETRLQAEVHRIGAVFDRRANAIPIAGRRQQFRAHYFRRRMF